MKLTIIILTQDTFEVDIPDTSTVLELKHKIKDIKHKELENIRIVHDDDIIENLHQLQEYNINNGSTLIVILQQPRDIKYLVPKVPPNSPKFSPYREEN